MRASFFECASRVSGLFSESATSASSMTRFNKPLGLDLHVMAMIVLKPIDSKLQMKVCRLLKRVTLRERVV